MHPLGFGDRRGLLCLLLCLLLVLPVALAGSFDLYCGDRSCYETLQLAQGRDASAAQIRKAFYKLSLVLHPDKAATDATVAEVQQRADEFQRVVTAYEVLSDDTSRSAYHSFLDHPALFSHHIRYYQHKVRAAQVSAWKVLSATALLATSLHWLYIRHRYQHVRRLLAAHPTVQQKMLSKVKQDMQAELGRVDSAQIGRRVAAERLEEYVSVKGSESIKPTLSSLLPLVLLASLPTLARSLVFQLRWVFWHGWLGAEYGEEEREYATTRALRMSWSKWRQVVPAEERDKLVARELWHKPNLDEFILEQKRQAAQGRRGRR
ncbi:DnaJ sub C member 25 [Xylographa carneopallida]|nr:DnaJ sub C member 25 [Xylographa carneopallida]